MFVSALITLREGLEAALIVGVVLGVLRKLGRTDRSKPVWAGVISAVIVSIVAALALNAFGVALEGPSEEAFEGVMMLLAAGVLTWMIFWMQAQGRQIQTDLESDVRQAVSAGNTWALFGLAFVAVVREGVETVLFLSAAASGATSSEVLIGGAVGLVVAVALGWLMFVAGKRLNVRVFFRVTGFLLRACLLSRDGLPAGTVCCWAGSRRSARTTGGRIPSYRARALVGCESYPQRAWDAGFVPQGALWLQRQSVVVGGSGLRCLLYPYRSARSPTETGGGSG